MQSGMMTVCRLHSPLFLLPLLPPLLLLAIARGASIGISRARASAIPRYEAEGLPCSTGGSVLKCALRR